MSELPHYCTGCGQMHGGSTRESDEVRIAKIQADRDVEVAKLARAEASQAIQAETDVAETAADTEVEVAAIEAESGVVAAEAVADALAPPAPETEVVPVETAPAEPEPETTPPPAESGPPAERGKKSPGFWDIYR